MQLWLPGYLSPFIKTLLSPTLLGILASTPSLADEAPALALQGDTYLSSELVEAMQSVEEPQAARAKELRGLEPIATPDSMFLLDEHGDSDYQSILTQVQVRQQLVARPHKGY